MPACFLVLLAASPAPLDGIERACTDGEARACVLVGVAAEGGVGTARDLPRALAAYRRGCASHEPTACYNLGVFLEDGRGTATDLSAAATAYRAACDLKEGRGCSNLGGLYERGRGVEADVAKAFALYKSACELGASIGCNNSGTLFLEGRGTPVDRARALSLFERSCRAGYDRACARWGTHSACDVATGEHCPSDAAGEERSREWIQAACGRGLQPSCVVYGYWHESEGRHAEAKTLYERACEAKDALGCNMLANLYRRGQAVSKDAARAAKLYGTACELGFAVACADLGAMHGNGDGVPRDPKRFRDLTLKACGLGMSDACLTLELLCRLGGSKDPRCVPALDAAAALGPPTRASLDKACSGGEAKACYELAFLWANGEGGPADPRKARELIELSCKKKLKEACDFIPLMKK